MSRSSRPLRYIERIILIKKSDSLPIATDFSSPLEIRLERDFGDSYESSP